MIYILIICCVVIVIISIRIFNNSKRNNERKKRQELWEKQQAERQVRLAPLIRKKEEEDKELSIEINIKCDDGITRAYMGSMYGIIIDYQEDISVNYISEETVENEANLQNKMIELIELRKRRRLLTQKVLKTIKDSEKDMIYRELVTLGNRMRELEFITATADEYFETRNEKIKIQNQKWFSSTGKYLNVDEIIELNRKKNSLYREYEERYEDIIGTMKVNWFHGLQLIFINDHYFIYSHGDPQKLFSGTIDGVTYINGLAVQNEINKSQIKEKLSPSKEPVKSNLNFDDLDEETKKSIEDQTLFVDEDGIIDESRGSGKILTNKLRFFVENINGINEDDISWDLTNETKPENDIDGRWHFKNGLYLMKCFSEENFEIEITDFLKQNNISKDNAQFKIDMKKTPLMPIEFYKGENFTIEIPEIENENYKLVVILENENSIENTLVDKELITTIFNEANKFQDENNHEEAITCYKKIIDRLDGEKDNIANNNLIIETVINSSSDENSTEQIGTPIDGVYFNLGQSYRALNEFKEAKEAFEKAIEVNPNTQAMVYHHLGVTKIQLGDFTTCIEDFTNALKNDENHYDSYYMRAAAYISEKSDLRYISKAKKDLQIYLKKYPEDGAANRLFDAIE